MISVIIPAYNEEKSIKNVLQSLVDQKTKHKFEVILVDNNSTDNTSKIAKTFLKKLNLKIISEKKQGRGPARARGAKEAKGEIFAYIDADTESFPDWIEAITDAFAEKNVVAVTGPWRVMDLGGFTQWFLNTFQEVAQLPYRVIRGHFWLNGMNMAIRKSSYYKVNGFNENLDAHEDVDITERLRKIGKIKYIKSMKVKTSGRRYKRGLLKGLFEYQKLAVQHFILGKKKIELSDKR